MIPTFLLRFSSSIIEYSMPALRFYLISLAIVCSLLLPFNAKAAEPEWEILRQGMELTTIEGQHKGHAFVITALRIDPELYSFTLFSAAWENGELYTPPQWARKKNLVAFLNAGMYLPDGITNTGYMRSGEKVNNPHIASRYGSFFVAEPKEKGLPIAAVLDKEEDSWQSLLPAYNQVVQNFRLFGKDGNSLWPANGPEHPIAALAEDVQGNIVFLHCETPVSVDSFCKALQAQAPSFLHVYSAMYLEGGVQATLMAEIPTANPDGSISYIPRFWVGTHPSDVIFGKNTFLVPLPNIIGVQIR